MGQTLQQKAPQGAQGTAPAPGAAQPPAAQAEVPDAVRYSWELSCDPAGAALNCRAKRMLVSKKTRKPIVTVFVAVPAATKKPTMVVRLPLGIYLPAGASVSFGQSGPKPLTLQRCGSSGCYGEYMLTDADIAALAGGAEMTFLVEDRERKPVQFIMRADAEGFSEAYARIK
jgi:invasion protein IalB